jgi:hypothetical protein
MGQRRPLTVSARCASILATMRCSSPACLEAMIDFVKAGKESYYIVSKFEHFEYAKVAPLFRKMSQEFEKLVYGLNQVKNELEERQHPITRQTKEFLM